MNIDNVKISTSLIMMKECTILLRRKMEIIFANFKPILTECVKTFLWDPFVRRGEGGTPQFVNLRMGSVLKSCLTPSLGNDPSLCG